MAGLAGPGSGKYGVGSTVSQEKCAPHCLEPRPVMTIVFRVLNVILVMHLVLSCLDLDWLAGWSVGWLADWLAG